MTVEEATAQLRADEILWNLGGDKPDSFLTATDEDFMTKEQKLRHRRQERKKKRRGEFRSSVTPH
jgi:hypothetical protein